MNHIPTDDQIRKDADFLGYSDSNTSRLLAHARRARSASSELDGYKRSHGAAGGGRPNGISDPTGDMACDDEPTTPEVERQHTLLFDMLAQAAMSKRATMNTMEALESHQQHRKPAGQTSTPCKSVGCDDQAEKRGMCPACYLWTYRWEQAHPGDVAVSVPLRIIEERQVKRKRGRVA